MRVPLSTYRLQFNAGFRFEDARRIVPYLADLGITDLYSSPILRARKGSTHGYDVVDATELNPELGNDADFNSLRATLDRHELGFVLDIVPNHMAASAENGWWTSVLENGPHSRFFHYFDIDWAPVASHGKVEKRVILPILGKPYGEALESQEIQLGYDPGGLHFRYYDRRLPLAPATYVRVLRECADALPQHGAAMELREIAKPTVASEQQQSDMLNSRFLKELLRRLYDGEPAFREALDATMAHINGEAGKPESFNTLDELLDAQWYRLAYWRIASEKINYRRFFDVADLVGIRVENPEVFEARHSKIFELVGSGAVTGLRIDHIDGLFDPVGHLRKLQMRLSPSEESGPFYVVVEKILAENEELPRDFAVSGTTGYDFLDTLNALFVDPKGLARLDRFYRSFTGIQESFADICYARKKQVIHELFSGEMHALGDRLATLATVDRNARDFAPSELLAALTEVTACMNVYRTYARGPELSEYDRQYVENAIRCARERSGTQIDGRAFTFIERVLKVDPPSYIEAERDAWLAFVMRWQQFTGRVMAKGVEDTSFYNFHRLVSLNEVGGEPGRHPDFDGVAELHRRNEQMVETWPDTMNATSTHDTKRSEDVRARINVLSEVAEVWEREVRRWTKIAEPLCEDGVPDTNVLLLIFQTLVGMWPLDEEELDSVPDRLKQYLEKAAREAKTQTSWIAPNAEYEQRLLSFGERLAQHEPFLDAFRGFQKRIAFHGFLNSLSQVVLKIASPGAPDFYQGTELWDFSLVDPDNRRPVDYDRRLALLKRLKTADSRGNLDLGTLLRRWFDGRVKLYVTWKSLEVRARRAETFRRGVYRALDGGPNVCAFTRGDDILVAVPRLTTRLTRPPSSPLGAKAWGDAALELSGRWRNAFTREEIEGDSLRLADVFASFPVAILERA